VDTLILPMNGQPFGANRSVGEDDGK